MHSPGDRDPTAILSSVASMLAEKGLPPGSVQFTGSTDEGLDFSLAGVKSTWRVRVNPSPTQFGLLPTAILLGDPRRLAHVSYSGTICINDGQGLSIDLSKLDEVMAQTLADAFRLLEGSEQDVENGATEFFDELEGYWEGLPSHPQGQKIRSSVIVDGTSRKIYAHVGKANKGQGRVCRFFTEHSGGTPPSEFKLEKHTALVGLYIALKTNIPPPAPGESLGFEFIQNLLAGFAGDETKLWDSLIADHRSKPNYPIYLLISQPRHSGGRSLIGLSFRLRKGSIDKADGIQSHIVVRHTPEYARERGGAWLPLASKHVVLLGCGSVGSEVADALAASGVGRFTLVDNETFEVENVFRHALGRHYVGLKKVDALAAHLQRRFPGVVVSVMHGFAQNWAEVETLAGIDGIVIAIGQPTVERVVLRSLRKRAVQLPVVVTWLEVLGLGGHAVALQTMGPGCLGCLYRNAEGEASLTLRTSYVEPGQVFTRNLTGCAGAFVPFSALHSRRTALLATEAMISLLASGSSPRYSYWVGDDRAARDAGVRPSIWHGKAKSSNPKEISDLVFSGNCLECGGVMNA